MHKYSSDMKNHSLTLSPHLSDLITVLETFKALSEEPRIRLVLALREEEQNVSDLVDVLELPQSTVSRHLAILRAAKLVITRREGTHIYYALKSSHVGDLVAQAFAHAEHERRSLPDHPDKARAKPRRSKNTTTPRAGVR
jgi:DNA-binding transcriptional ArsR family regulator